MMFTRDWGKEREIKRYNLGEKSAKKSDKERRTKRQIETDKETNVD